MLQLLVKEGLLDLRIFLVNRLITTTELIRSIFFSNCFNNWTNPTHTGVLIAAYLVYHLRVRSNDALRYVRLKRPGAVQTRRQIECVKEFEAYFLPQVSNAVLPEIRGGAMKSKSVLRNSWMLISFGIRIINNLADFFWD